MKKDAQHKEHQWQKSDAPRASQTDRDSGITFEAKLQELLELVRDTGLVPPDDFVVTTVGPTDFGQGGRPRLNAAALVSVADFGRKFQALLRQGYPWLNLTYYGQLGRKGIVAVELPGPTQSGATSSEHTSVNLSGPPMQVVSQGGDAGEFVILAPALASLDCLSGRGPDRADDRTFAAPPNRTWTHEWLVSGAGHHVADEWGTRIHVLRIDSRILPPWSLPRGQVLVVCLEGNCCVGDDVASAVMNPGDQAAFVQGESLRLRATPEGSTCVVEMIWTPGISE